MAYLTVEAINTAQQTGFFKKRTAFIIRLIRGDNTITEYYTTCTDAELDALMGKLVIDLEVQARKTLLGRGK